MLSDRSRTSNEHGESSQRIISAANFHAKYASGGSRFRVTGSMSSRSALA
jgi:hypothetical protein